MRSENRERPTPAHPKFRSWNCSTAEPSTAPSRPTTPASTAACSWACTSTGIYCRPICPARLPKFENCRFFASAAAAQEAGFRPCLRCRPEIAPDLAFWRGTANTVSRALALIAEGALDGERCRRRGAGRAAGRRRPPAAAAVPAPSRRLADRRRPDAPRAVRQAAPARHAPADDRGGAGLGLRQRAPLQRDLPRRCSAGRPARFAEKGRRRQFGARRRHAAPGLSAAL